ncbi:MAG TPA: DUF2283 domain-containing protein [Planktothrix sp.]|jgi:uncharacterized protein YuzE
MLHKEIKLKMTYSGGCSYLYLTEIGKGGVASTQTVRPKMDSGEHGHMINLDFDKDGRLLGIELIADDALPIDLLRKLKETERSS